MRIFHLRVYSLRNNEIFDFYREVVYPRHLASFPLFGIEAHGFWTTEGDAEYRFFVLLSYPAGENIDELEKRYMASSQFLDDIRDFDSSNILSVESTILIPTAASPLR